MTEAFTARKQFRPVIGFFHRIPPTFIFKKLFYNVLKKH